MSLLLPLAPSSGVYAALLSDGIKLYEPWPYPPPRDWLIRDKDGYFAGDAFEQKLKILLAEKASLSKVGQRS